MAPMWAIATISVLSVFVILFLYVIIQLRRDLKECNDEVYDLVHNTENKVAQQLEKLEKLRSEAEELEKKLVYMNSDYRELQKECEYLNMKNRSLEERYLYARKSYKK